MLKIVLCKKLFQKRNTLLFLWLISLQGTSQTFAWWRDNVRWDGVSHWYEYLIISPAFFGPNALPVPAINNGSTDSILSLGITGNFHFSPGDKTQNISLYGNYVTRDGTVSFDAQFIPYERFAVTHKTKEKRNVYFQEYDAQSATGDVVINSTFQPFKKKAHRFQLAIRLGIRMPSGGKTGAARYTDAPGYWIDAGGAVALGSSHWKLTGMGGFYVWQTNEDALPQNDAFLFGAGTEWNKSGNRIQSYVAGYVGYKNNGDKPVVFRFNFEKKKSRIIYLLRFFSRD